MPLLRGLLAGVGAVVLVMLLLAGGFALTMLLASRGTGSGGIGAISGDLGPPLLGLLVIFAAAFRWEYRRAKR
jgi:hypothetical protein